jgi:formamidopyrimidine-DNA glycosylase
MPELPEVETVRRGIERNVVGLTIESVSVPMPQILKKPVTDPAEFENELVGREFMNARRRGKHLIFGLSNGYALYAHLNMRGQMLVVRDYHLPVGKYLCVSIRFTNDVELRYHDIWRWGELRLLHDNQEEIFKAVPALVTMGDEPLSDDFDGASLEKRAKLRSGSPIKTVLLDQAVIAGVGNIYADESLYKAGIAPLRKPNTLSKDEWQRLTTEIKNVLNEAIAGGGTVSNNYVDVDGIVGQYQPKVYGRATENCGKCASPLTKIKLGGRTTVYCPICQR